ERQEQQNVRKLKGLHQRNWERLVDLIDQGRNQAPLDEITALLGLESKQEVEALAARGNMTAIVQMLHDKSSQFLDMLIYALKEGKLCIVDISQMRGQQGLILSGLVLRRIFDHNQQQFTAAIPETIPTLAVIEEAQSVLNEKATASEPYIAWVKEGRKYDLGALLITQQPGSIPHDILSQGDNWFIFHLLSTVDLTNVQRANAHFSADILSVLLNEPIPGQGVFWSSVGGKPYPVSLRVLSFEEMYSPLDPFYENAAAATFAQVLRDKFALPRQLTYLNAEELPQSPDDEFVHPEAMDQVDILALHKRNAIEALKKDREIMDQLHGRGIPWGTITGELEKKLPPTLENRHDLAYYLVREALESIFGEENEGWHSYRRGGNNTKPTTFVKAGKKA
ncbi:MAG: ATP-binding protein, partial [Ktedonobacteraceae bacterium]